MSLTTTVLALALAGAPQMDADPKAADAAANQELNQGADFREVDVVEQLGGQVPESLSFTDENGQTVRMNQFFKGDKPVVLTLVYYQCPALCNLVLSGVAQALKSSGLDLGVDYRAVTVSIDPTETPAMAKERKRGHLQAVGLDPESKDWSFLVGKDDDIRKLASAAGFKYQYDADLKQYAHSAVFFVLTPEGKLSRYLYGVRYPSRDLRMALVEASSGRVGTSFDRVLLTCYQYDPASRRYGFYVNTYFRVGGGLVFIGVAGLLAFLWRRELKRGTA